MTRSIIKWKDLPRELWAEAIATVYLQNRCPTKSGRNMTPKEAWSSFKPNLAHLRVFGCIAFTKNHEARRINLDDK